MLFNNKLFNVLTKLNLVEYIEQIKPFNEYNLEDFESDEDINFDNFKKFYENNKLTFEKFMIDYINYSNINIKLLKNEIRLLDIKNEFLQTFCRIINYLEDYELLNLKKN